MDNRNFNPGIKCYVNTCHYYATGDHCTAQKIEVQHRNARNSSDTDCETFRPSGNMS